MPVQQEVYGLHGVYDFQPNRNRTIVELDGGHLGRGACPGVFSAFVTKLIGGTVKHERGHEDT